jgi:hypothetical protein
MRTLLISVISLFIFCQFPSIAQSKKDSLKLKADLEAIRQGKPVKTAPKKKSVLVKDNKHPVKVDTAAIKGEKPLPMPTEPNNPNPHDPRPTVVNPNPPIDPAVPQGTPSKKEKSKKKPK